MSNFAILQSMITNNETPVPWADWLDTDMGNLRERYYKPSIWLFRAGIIDCTQLETWAPERTSTFDSLEGGLWNGVEWCGMPCFSILSQNAASSQHLQHHGYSLGLHCRFWTLSSSLVASPQSFRILEGGSSNYEFVSFFKMSAIVCLCQSSLSRPINIPASSILCERPSVGWRYLMANPPKTLRLRRYHSRCHTTGMVWDNPHWKNPLYPIPDRIVMLYSHWLWRRSNMVSEIRATRLQLSATPLILLPGLFHLTFASIETLDTSNIRTNSRQGNLDMGTGILPAKQHDI